MPLPQETFEPQRLSVSGRGRCDFGRGLAAALAGLLLASAIMAALAAADPVQDPGTADPTGGGQTDTLYTPVPQPGNRIGWTQVGGAVHPGAGDTVGNYKEVSGPTPHTVDFFTVSFRNADNGLAAGAACTDPATKDEQLATCARVPVIYQYARWAGANQPPAWKEVYRGGPDRGDGQGFVGAIAWLGPNRALAVGGNGCYPRREEPCSANAPPTNAVDPYAGDGRAWLFEDGQWHALAQLPPGVGGMTALDTSPRSSDCGAASTECGLAGGLGQVWMWRNGQFEPSYKYDPGKPASDQTNSPFRVRSIKFSPTANLGDWRAIAVTSGCCHVDPITGRSDPTSNYPRVMRFLDGSWTIGPVFNQANEPNTGQPDPTRGGADPRLQSFEDSFYSVSFGGRGKETYFSVVGAPGGPEASTEPGSQILGRLPTNGSGGTPVQGAPAIIADSSPKGTNLYHEAAHADLSSTRLVAGDGDLQGYRTDIVTNYIGSHDPTKPDGIIDWAVGELRSSGEAVAFTSTAQPSGLDAPNPLNCPDTGIGVVLTGKCQADTQASAKLKSAYLFKLPSYALNGFTMVDGTAWAVGDRGALMVQGGSGAAAGLTPATLPKLGAAQASQLSNRQAYDPFRPVLSDEAGLVPPLASQPVTKEPSARMLPAGSPNPRPSIPESVQKVVMSRDGSDGWAVGPSRAGSDSGTATTLYHFNGARWIRCDALGVRFGAPSIVEPDSACASLHDLVTAPGGGGKIQTLARVPLEEGADQSKANDFELVAIARFPSRGSVHDQVLRYQGGTWNPDKTWTDQLTALRLLPVAGDVDLAFSTPDDAWITSSSSSLKIFRLVDGSWIDCLPGNPPEAPGCNDGDGVLPIVGNAGRADYAGTSQKMSGVHMTTVGKRVYMYGTRTDSPEGTSAVNFYPMILSKEPGKDRKWVREFDPKQSHTVGGVLNSLSIGRGSDGTLTGWGLGDFSTSPQTASIKASNAPDETPLIRLDPKTGQWKMFPVTGAAAAYLTPSSITGSAAAAAAGTEQVVTLPGQNGGNGPAFATLTTGTVGNRPAHPLVWFNPAHDRWEVFPTPWSMAWGNSDLPQQAIVEAMSPDNQGGLWLPVNPMFGGGGPWFYHYTEQVPTPVFSDVPHPIRQPITATATGGDGSFWVATAGGRVYRYDRLTGWDQVALRGWDSGGAVGAPAYAIAVGTDGQGVVVGKNGRMADVGPAGAVLDAAAGRACPDGGPCGTSGRTLRAAAVASDGSTLVGGDARTLRWKPVGGDFRSVSLPDMQAAGTITGISMPNPDRAWLATDTGQVFAGTQAGGDWQWAPEATNSDGEPLTLDANRRATSLHAIAVTSSGHGYAVGDRGVILERATDGSWRRLRTGYNDDLLSLTLGPGGKGALVGGDGGLILTLAGNRFEVARPSDYFDPFVAAHDGAGLGRVVGVGLLPGSQPGQVEAWATLQVPAEAGSGANRSPNPSEVLHYTSDASDPLLAAGAGRASPLPDTQPPQPGQIAFAAFGKSDCQMATSEVCPEFVGSRLTNEVIARRVRDAVLARARQPGGLGFTVFTGDVDSAAGSRDPNAVSGPLDASTIHERWAELIARPLADAGVPFYGAIGGQDLSHTQACDPVFHVTCLGTQATRAGLNLAWRQALAGSDRPWGNQAPASRDGLEFQPVDTAAADTGARTHYAVDVVRGGKRVLRLVVVDTSLKTLSGTAGVQNPVQDQLTWLDQTLSDRDAGERAVVVSETPSYTYGSAGATTDTLTDQAAFEALMIKNRVDAVVSGRLGWNGLYWLAAPGLHAPCPGGSYPAEPPSDATQLCQGTNDAAGPADSLASALQGLGAPSVPTPSKQLSGIGSTVAGQLGHPIPNAVAASAGGKFGPDGSSNGTGGQGFWHGYTLIRIDPNGQYAAIVEQRPVFDWIGIQASDHTVQPGNQLRLHGYGREPVGTDQPIRYDDIDGPAITHHFDLVMADAKRPYVPQVDTTNTEHNHYVPVPADLGAQIDDTGIIRYRGSGNHPPLFAVAILSVGDQVATWPVVLAPRRSFRLPAPPPPQRIQLPPRPRVEVSAPAQLPPPPTAPTPIPPQLNLTFPQLPALPSLSANAPQAAPPAPPAPPPPPASPVATALQINPAPVGLNVAPPATVIPPPAPPIQPAPPSGARREARQRQAAVAKSEEGGGGQETASQEAGGENGGSSESASTRLEPRRDHHPFTSLDRRAQPSAWTRDLWYGGGLGLAALVLALGWNMMRPGPRRREPELPAPAWSRTWRER